MTNTEVETPRLSKDELIERIRNTKAGSKRPAFVAISGFGGSGKSTLALSISEKLGDVTVIPIDDFIVGARTERSSDWQTFDRSRLSRDVLERARIGETLQYQRFNSGEWASGKTGTRRDVEIGRLVIVEGCGIIHPSILGYYDLSAWIDCPQKIALASSKRRDSMETKLFGTDDTDNLWDEVWGPNDKDFFENFRPDQLAEVLVEKQF